MAGAAGFGVYCDRRRFSNGKTDAAARKFNAGSNAGLNGPHLDRPHSTERSEEMNRYGVLTSLLLAMQLIVLRQLFVI